MTYKDNLQKVLDATRLLAVTLNVVINKQPLSEEQRQSIYVIRNILGCKICGPGLDAFPATICHGEEAHGLDEDNHRCKCCNKIMPDCDKEFERCDYCYDGHCKKCNKDSEDTDRK